MNSSVATGQIVCSVATVQPVVEWCFGGFVHPIPEAVSAFVAMTLITLGHATFNVLKQKYGTKTQAQIINDLIATSTKET